MIRWPVLYVDLHVAVAVVPDAVVELTVAVLDEPVLEDVSVSVDEVVIVTEVEV